MLYTRYTKKNLLKDYDSFVNSKITRYNALCKLTFNKKTREFIKEGFTTENYKEILDEILSTHDEHLENEDEKIIVFRTYEDLNSVNNFLTEVVAGIQERRPLMRRFYGEDPEGFDWCIPREKGITDRMYKILLEEKRKGTKFTKREKRVLNKLDKIMEESENEIENEEINMEELNLLKEKYDKLYNMVTQLTKEMSLLKEQLSNGNVKSTKDNRKKLDSLQPVVLLNDLKVYNNYNEIEEDIKSNYLEIPNVYNLFDVYQNSRYNIGKSGDEKAYWITKDLFDTLTDEEKKIAKYMANNSSMNCIYSEQIPDVYFKTVEDASKYCEENNFEFCKIAYIKECLDGKRKFAGISQNGIPCMWNKVKFKSLLNKGMEEEKEEAE